jgi:cell wall-associated NlpC family hydrolase
VAATGTWLVRRCEETSILLTTMLRSLAGAALVFALLAGPAQAAAPALVEVLDANGRVSAQGGAGRFAYPASGAVVDVGSARVTATAAELADVSLLGGRVQAARVVVPRHGLRGAAVEGLVVDGRIVSGRPNTLVPLAESSYLVVLQTAVVPGSSSRRVGLVGIRVHVGDASLGLPEGSDLLVGLPPAAATAEPAARTSRPGAAAPWAMLGFAGSPGHAAVLVDSPELVGVPSAGPIGTRAVAIAERFLGVPYVWGGATPTGFDCSGLVMYVYGQLGVSLVHFSGTQYHEGAPVPASALAPGDLVFFHPGPLGPGHVGMYIGEGRFIHAPHTGDVVKISSLSEFGYASGFVGATRPYAR